MVQSETSRQLKLFTILLSVAMVLLTVAVNTLGQPAYWLDELFSVVVSLLPFENLVDELLKDVHPPVYQMLLKLWMLAFGDSELATRLMSTLFLIGSFVLVYRQRLMLGAGTVAIYLLLLASNWVAVYYGMETRAYAMLLFASTWASLCFIQNHRDNKAFYQTLIACVFLSLVHFFGLIVSGIMLAYMFFHHLNKPVRIVAIAAASAMALSWPAVMFLFGDLQAKAGGGSWIESTGPVTAMQFALQSVLPHVYHPITILWGFGLAGQCAVVGGIVVGLFALHKTALFDGAKGKPFAKLVFVVLGSILAICLIELHTPISAPRYYSAWIPPVYLLFAFTLSSLRFSNALFLKGAFCVALVVVLLGAAQTAYKLKSKLYGFESRPIIAQQLVYMAKTEGLSSYYFADSDEAPPPYSISHALRNYYFSRASEGQVEIMPTTMESLSEMEMPAAVIYGFYRPSTEAAVREALLGYQVQNVIPVEYSQSGYFLVREKPEEPVTETAPQP